VIALASLLSLQTSALRIDEILDRSNVTRRRALLTESTEVIFTTEAVTEALGYEDPTEMATALQEQLSGIHSEAFVDSFLSECETQGALLHLIYVLPPSCRKLHRGLGHDP
jgi:hypothetical protein